MGVFHLTCRTISKLPKLGCQPATFRQLLYGKKCFVYKYCTAAGLNATNCNIGTIGHVDHGKTTLTAAITKYLSEENQSCKYVSYEEIDSAPAEKARGITINIAHVGYATKKRRYAHVDCPGHMDFVKNMIVGASQMDGAILLVSADDGPMPQTKEHLLLAKQVGIKYIVVFINKADISDKETMELIEIETRELLAHYGFDSNNSPFVCGSALLALNGDNSEYGRPSIKALLDAIDSYIPDPERNLNAPFIFPIDNILSIPGRGTVVVGTLKQGIIKKNSESHLVGFNEKIKTSISDIEIFKKSVPSASAGETCGVLLRGVKSKSVKKGMILCSYNHLAITNRCEVQLYLLTPEEGGRKKPIQKTGFRGQIFSDTWNINGRLELELPENTVMLMPGEHAVAKITTLDKMPFKKGQTFTMRELNQKTVITGVITKLLEPVAVTDRRKLKVCDAKGT